MTEIEHLLYELRQAHAGEPWHGPSRVSVLADVTAAEAARRVSTHGHNIWELALHMRAWTREVARRVREGVPALPAEGDWPALPEATDAAWQATLAGLDESHHELLAVVRAMNPHALDEIVAGARDSPLGSGVSYRVMLHGVAQHDAYHTGQAALLKRIIRG